MKSLSFGSKATVLVAVLAGLFAGTLPCFASEAFKKGVSFYTQGQYQAAANAFIDAACAEPGNYVPHFALGNTYIKLGKGELAANEYEMCLEMYPDAKTKASAKAALRSLSGAVATKADRSDESGRYRLDSALSELGQERVEQQSRAAERKRNQITRNAEQYAVRVKENAKARVEQLKEASSWYAFDSSTANGRAPILPPGVEDAVLKSADAQAEKAIERAKEKVKEVNPSGAADVTDGLRSQLYSTSGVRLSPRGTNIYVRNYEGASKTVAATGASVK